MITKSEMKLAISGDFHKGFEEAKRAEFENSYRWDGAKSSLRGAAKKLEDLEGHITKDVKEGGVSDEAAEYARLYVRRAVEVVRSLRLKAEVHEERSKGRMEAFGIALSMTDRAMAQAKIKIDAGVAEEGVAGSNRPGPVNRLAELRARGRGPQTPSDEKQPEPDQNLAVPQTQVKTKTAKKAPRKKAVKKKATPRKKAAKKS